MYNSFSLLKKQKETSMKIIRLPESVSWTDVSTASGVVNTRSALIRNYGTKTVYVTTSTLQPTSKDDCYPLLSNETISVEPTGKNIWVLGEDGFLWVEDQVASGIAQFINTDISGFSTANAEQTPRLKTETSTAAFYEGRQYRFFKELNITDGTDYTIKIVITKDLILRGLSLVLESGHCHLETIDGGTDSTPFNNQLTIIRKNTMSTCPAILSSTQLIDGGAQAGGTIIDLITVEASSQQNFRSSVGSAPYDERGVGAGTYYWKFRSITGGGKVTGVFRCFWEEAK